MVMSVDCIFTTKEGNCKAWDLQPCIFRDPRVLQKLSFCRLAKENILPVVWKDGTGEVKKADPEFECPW